MTSASVRHWDCAGAAVTDGGSARRRDVDVVLDRDRHAEQGRPNSSAPARRSSAWSASASACSASTTRSAMISGSIFAIGSSVASTTACEATSLSRISLGLLARRRRRRSAGVHRRPRPARGLEVSGNQADAAGKMSVSSRRDCSWWRAGRCAGRRGATGCCGARRKPSAKFGGGVTQAIAKPARKPSAKLLGATDGSSPRQARQEAVRAARGKQGQRQEAGPAGARGQARRLLELGAFGSARRCCTLQRHHRRASQPRAVEPHPARASTDPDGPSPARRHPEPAADGPKLPSTEAVGVTVDDRTGYTARLSRAERHRGLGRRPAPQPGRGLPQPPRLWPSDDAGATFDFPLTGCSGRS